MMTEREAWIALVIEANRLGRRGFHIRNVGILPPATTTGAYTIVIDQYTPTEATGKD